MGDKGEKAPAKGKGKGSAAKGKKGTPAADGQAPPGAAAPEAALEGVIASVDGAAGVIAADDGDECGFRIKDVPEGSAVAGTRVKFAPAPPPGKGKGKEGNKEAKFKNIVVLAASDDGSAAAASKADAKAAETEPPVEKEENVQKGGEKEERREQTSTAAVKGGEAAKEVGEERVLRDDEECFVADYTGVKNDQVKTPKFEQFDKVRRARIARDLVEMDPEVELRIRKHPSKDAEEIRVLTADDMVEVVGTCGEWLRLAGDDEQWIKYMQSENPDIPEQLVDVLGPSLLSVASSFTSGWFSSGAAASQDDESAATSTKEETKPAAAGGGGGWGFGGWGKSLSSYVPSGALEQVSAMSSKVLAVGSDCEPAGSVPASAGSLSDALKAAQAEGGDTEDIGSDITDSVSKKFDKEVKLDEGGLASVRVATQAISIFEGSLGWLGNTATSAANTVQEKAKSVKETVTSEEFVDKAWNNVKSGVQAGGSVAASATEMAKSTRTAVVNSAAVNKATAMGKSAMTSVGSNARTVISTAKSTLLGDEIDEASVYPNRALGGVIAIELSGCIIERDPHVDDEDDDPFMSDDYSSTPMTPGAIEAVQRLVNGRFQDRVYLMCVAAPQVQARMLRWLSSNDFYKKTGTTREKVHFCREWDEKADVCKELGVTVVVESSSSSAGSLESVVETALLFGDGADVLQGSKPRQDGDEGAQALLWWDSVCSELMPPHKAVEQVADSGKKVQGEGEGVKDTGKKSESKDKIGEKVVKQLEGKKEKGVDEDEQFFSGDEDQES